MYIEPLSNETLDEAVNLVNQFFPAQNLWENASLSFRFSLKLNSIITKIAFYLVGVTEVRYWVAVDEKSGKVRGTTGLYCYRQDRDEAYWLNWTCVALEARGQGIGGRLVDFAIEKARAEGKRFLRLYTTTRPDEATAQILYEHRGLKLIGESQLWESQYKRLYRELEL